MAKSQAEVVEIANTREKRMAFDILISMMRQTYVT